MNCESGIVILSTATNCPVVRMAERKFPGVVIQGDTLFSLLCRAKSIGSSLQGEDCGRVADDCEFLIDTLAAMLENYEYVLTQNGISLPYVKR